MVDKLNTDPSVDYVIAENMGLMELIHQKCVDCVYDDFIKLSEAEQIQECDIESCPLHSVRCEWTKFIEDEGEGTL